QLRPDPPDLHQILQIDPDTLRQETLVDPDLARLRQPDLARQTFGNQEKR
ncbi:Hypothetical predicted protein, partial [Pelobates cultripes]